MNQSLLDSTHDSNEAGLDAALRPRRFADFVGQDEVKNNLEIYIQAAKMRGDALDHILFSGLPGLGKTSLADIVAREMGGTLHTTSGPVLEKPGDLAGMLTNLKRGDLLFIDEIHRLPATVEEYLYSAMEDFTIDILLDQGPRARSVRIDVERFTLIGATTRDGLLSPPFRARFGVLERLEPYPPEHLVRIATRSAELLGMSLSTEGARLIAANSRGTPRIVNRFVRRMRDVAQVRGQTLMDEGVVLTGLKMMGVDDSGLLRVDRRILETLALAPGQPIGLRTVAITVGEDDRTIEDVYEPHLIRSGFILKTARGRILTARGFQVLGLEPPAQPPSQPLLFVD